MSYRAVVLADLPTAYWRLGEASGTSAADATGGGHTGTYTGGFTLAQTGALTNAADTAAAFNGTTGYVTVPAITLVGPITLEAWIKFAADADVANAPIVLSHDSAGNYLRVQATRVVVCSLKISGAQQTATSVATLTAGVWHHVVGTWSSGDDIRVYVDGVQVATSAATYAGVVTATPSAVNIGCFQSPTLFFLGSIDEAALYPTALSAERIGLHYAAGLFSLDEAAAARPTREQVAAVLVADGVAGNPNRVRYASYGAGVAVPGTVPIGVAVVTEAQALLVRGKPVVDLTRYAANTAIPPYYRVIAEMASES